MQTSHFDPTLKTPCGQPMIPPGPPDAAAALRAERIRLGLTPEELERRQLEALMTKPF